MKTATPTLLAALVLTTVPSWSRAEPAPAREQRLAWWHEAKFGLFIHWGLYSLPAGEWNGKSYDGIGEWIMYKARIPLAEYEGLARRFNPVKFDAEAWAQLAQDAGMKYLIITSKHHDGFSMFGSQVDPFNIVDATPFQRDPMKELAAACAKRGLKFGFYYSQAQDWHAPGGAIWEGRHENDPVYDNPRWDPRQEGDFETYFTRKALPQVRELLSGYGPISVLWFDTPLKVMSEDRAARLEALVHDLQPNCLVSGRLGGKFQSDYDSEGDNAIPNLARAGAWETPATLNDTWGFKKNDHHWKKPEDLTFKLIDIVSKGGNYLLNVGPDGEGLIPQPSQDMLRAVGRWLKTHGEAVYGAGRCPFGQEFGELTPPPDGKGQPAFVPRKAWRCTTQTGKLYLHVFEWPATGTLQLPQVADRISRAYVLSDPAHPPVPFEQRNGVTLTLQGVVADPLATVICLETNPPAPAQAAPQAATAMQPFTATGEWAFSSLPGYEPGKSSIFSKDPAAAATWRPGLRSVGPVRLSLHLVTHEGSDPRAKVEVFSGGKTHLQTVDQTAGEPRWLGLGTFDFTGQGEEFVRVSHSGKGNLRVSALKLEILDGTAGALWQTLILDELLTCDLAQLQREAPKTLRAGPPDPDQWELAFADEFNGEQLNPEVWQSANGETWGRLLSARYPENATVSNGLLHLVTRKEHRGGKEWTTAMISTRKFRQKYGYWESRYRYAAATGLNQAFWMNAGPKDKSLGFEIDVNEGHYPADVNATLHQSGLPSVSKRFVAGYDLAADFHLYAVEWNEREVIYFFDGQEIHRVPNTKAHLEVPVIYSTAVLSWAGPVTDALDGKSMDVDWVRVYRRKPAAP